MPKDHYSDLMKIQSAVLATVRTTAWQQLANDDLDRDPEMVVPAAEVLAMTLCLINFSNLSELISQIRRKKILESVDSTWAAQRLPNGHLLTLCMEMNFRSHPRIKDTAITKAASITKRKKRGKADHPTPTGMMGNEVAIFFEGGPPAKYGSRQGKSFFQYSTPGQKESNPSRRGISQACRGKAKNLVSMSQCYHSTKTRN